MKARRRKRGHITIFRFSQVGGKKKFWTAELSQTLSNFAEYGIYDHKGIRRGIIQSKKSLKDGRLWIQDNGKGSQIYDTGFRFNMRRRKDMLNAVRLAFLKTQHWDKNQLKMTKASQSYSV